MLKFTLPVVSVILLAGCASTGEWRTLSIDGSDEAAFGVSLSQINDSLSNRRRDMFALALVDIAQTGVSSAAEGGSATYTEEEYRRELDGLTYDGVIALADESGSSVYSMYYSFGRRAPGDSGLGFAPPRQGATFAADGRPLSDYRPGGDRWPITSGDSGLIYPYD